MTLFVGSQSFISLPRFMLVSAVVSELRESNQNKKEAIPIYTGHSWRVGARGKPGFAERSRERRASQTAEHD